MRDTKEVAIVEVGPRDGFQSIVPLIPSETKIDHIRRLHGAGLRRIEVASFVSASAVPQLADGPRILQEAKLLPGLETQVLAPTVSHARRAAEHGADRIAFVLSVSEAHNFNNLRRTCAQSTAEFAQMVDVLPPGTAIRINLATAFDCPFDGAVPADSALGLLDALLAYRSDIEVALCDTTGRATPDQVEALFRKAKGAFGVQTEWAFHGHDTYGLGVANSLAAIRAGVSVIDAAYGGLGGCPFAPGATGNVATEDLVWTLAGMGVETSIDLAKLIDCAEAATRLPGACSGGRVRTALQKRANEGAAV